LSSNEPREIVIVLDGKKLALLTLLIIVVSTLAYTYFTSLASYMAPSENLPMHIVAASTADQYGNPKSIFTRGELVLINATVEMAIGYYVNSGPYYYFFTSPTKYLLIVQVMYGDTPVFLGFTYYELGPDGKVSVGVGYRLPDNANTGTYTVEIFVWSNWLTKGGNIIADNSGRQFTFQVTG